VIVGTLYPGYPGIAELNWGKLYDTLLSSGVVNAPS